MNARADTVRTQVRLYIATAAGDRGWDDTRQAWLARAATRLGIPYSRIRNLWYGRGRAYADEYEEMRARITEQKWRQIRHEERLHDLATEISILARGNTSPLEHQTSAGERAGDAADTDAPLREP